MLFPLVASIYWIVDMMVSYIVGTILNVNPNNSLLGMCIDYLFSPFSLCSFFNRSLGSNEFINVLYEEFAFSFLFSLTPPKHMN